MPLSEYFSDIYLYLKWVALTETDMMMKSLVSTIIMIHNFHIDLVWENVISPFPTWEIGA